MLGVNEKHQQSISDVNTIAEQIARNATEESKDKPFILTATQAAAWTVFEAANRFRRRWSSSSSSQRWYWKSSAEGRRGDQITGKRDKTRVLFVQPTLIGSCSSVSFLLLVPLLLGNSVWRGNYHCGWCESFRYDIRTYIKPERQCSSVLIKLQ